MPNRTFASKVETKLHLNRGMFSYTFNTDVTPMKKRTLKTNYIYWTL